MAAGRVGHVGLLQSAAMVAHALGWKLDRIEAPTEHTYDFVYHNFGELKTGEVLFREPLTHAAENIGDKPLHIILVELKSETTKTSPQR